jgi:hypothetical protein
MVTTFTTASQILEFLLLTRVDCGYCCEAPSARIEHAGGGVYRSTGALYYTLYDGAKRSGELFADRGLVLECGNPDLWAHSRRKFVQPGWKFVIVARLLQQYLA